MKKLLLCTLMLASIGRGASVVISDTIRYPDQSLASGSVTISWPTFTTVGGTTIAAGSVRSTITSGVLSVSLEPNDTAVPSGITYSASFALGRGSYTERWLVYTSGSPLTIAQIVTSTIPTPALTIALAQLSPNGCAKGGILAMSTAWGCLAVGTNGYVLTADSTQPRGLKWAASAGGGGGGTWGGIGGTLCDQTDLCSALAAKEVSLTFSLPLVRTVNTISLPVSTSLADGYLSATDWTTFNGKQASMGNAFTAFTGPTTSTKTFTLPNASATILTSNAAVTVPQGGTGITSGTSGGIPYYSSSSTIASSAAMTANAVMKGGGAGSAPVASGCTIDVSNQLACPGGFSGSGTGGFVDLAGATSGVARIQPPAIAGTPTFTLPGTVSDTLMGTLTALLATQLPALTGDVTSSPGSAATTVGKINGTALSGLPTGPQCNTTTTGVPYGCASSDIVGTIGAAAIANSKLANPSTIVSGATCTLGSTCAPVTMTFGGQIVIPGAKFKLAYTGNVGSGDVDLYTAPGSTRAMTTPLSCYNTAGTTTTAFVQVKISSTYYRIGGSSTVNTIARSNVSSNGWILEPGEILAINTTQAGLNCWSTVIEYPSTVPVKTARLLTLANGDNTVYTVPSATTAIGITSSLSSGQTGYYFNASGGSRTITWYNVPSGSSIGTTTQANTATVISVGTALSAVTPFFGGSAGDALAINTNAATATQIAWVNVAELPN